MSLEECLEYLNPDELVEITPQSIRCARRCSTRTPASVPSSSRRRKCQRERTRPRLPRRASVRRRDHGRSFAMEVDNGDTQDSGDACERQRIRRRHPRRGAAPRLQDAAPAHARGNGAKPACGATASLASVATITSTRAARGRLVPDRVLARKDALTIYLFDRLRAAAAAHGQARQAQSRQICLYVKKLPTSISTC